MFNGKGFGKPSAGNKPAPMKSGMSFKDLMRTVSGAKAAGGYKFITQAGHYILAVESIIYKDGYNGKSVIANFAVAASQANGGNAPHKVGERVGTVFKPWEGGPNSEFKAGLYKAFLLSITGLSESEANAPSSEDPNYTQLDMLGDQIVNDEQPMMGKLVDCVSTRKTSKKGENICANVFSYMEETDADVAAQAQGLRDGTWPSVE